MPKGIYTHKKGYKRPAITEEWRNNLSRSHKGQIAWNKGVLGYLSGIKHWCFGKHRTEEDRQKISVGRKGKHAKSEHWAWKGDYAGYRAFHSRLGKARVCELCGSTGGSKRGCHWANLNGNYEDMNDYISMCPKCHKNYDLGNINIETRRSK